MPKAEHRSWRDGCRLGRVLQIASMACKEECHEIQKNLPLTSEVQGLLAGCLVAGVCAELSVKGSQNSLSLTVIVALNSVL